MRGMSPAVQSATRFSVVTNGLFLALFSVAPSLLIAADIALAADIPVAVELLSGTVTNAELVQLNETLAKLRQPEGVIEVPLSQILTVKQATASKPPRTAEAEKALTDAALRDGSRIKLSSLSLQESRLLGKHPVWGEMEFGRNEVTSLRLAATDAKVDAAWKELSNRDLTRDLVVLRKGEVLDHLEGTVIGIGEKTIQFLLDGDEVPVKRERVFGIVLAKGEVQSPSLIRCDLDNNETILVDQVSLADGKWTLSRQGQNYNAELEYGPISIDYSSGKLVYLSEQEPRSAKYTPFFGYTWEYRKDRSFEGRPLAVGQRTYRRGLAVHSKSELTWQLGGEFRRFQTVMGYDPEISTASTALVRILGDGKELLKVDLVRGNPPHSVDLDITDISQMTIVVDFGTDEVDIGDRIHFGNAKVVK